jgi:hypothetical protein
MQLRYSDYLYQCIGDYIVCVSVPWDSVLTLSEHTLPRRPRTQEPSHVTKLAHLLKFNADMDNQTAFWPSNVIRTAYKPVTRLDEVSNFADLDRPSDFRTLLSDSPSDFRTVTSIIYFNAHRAYQMQHWV